MNDINGPKKSLIFSMHCHPFGNILSLSESLYPRANIIFRLVSTRHLFPCSILLMVTGEIPAFLPSSALLIKSSSRIFFMWLVTKSAPTEFQNNMFLEMLRVERLNKISSWYASKLLPVISVLDLIWEAEDRGCVSNIFPKIPLLVEIYTVICLFYRQGTAY